MTALWDTSLASRLHQTSPELEYVRAQTALGVPVGVAAPTVLEVVYGFAKPASDAPGFARALAWFTELVGRGDLAVVPFDGAAALVAGRVRAARPHPPPSRRDKRSKTMRQAAWLLDIQIAATAFAAGRDVATENRADFEALAATLAALYPSAPPLAVVDGPVAA